MDGGSRQIHLLQSGKAQASHTHNAHVSADASHSLSHVGAPEEHADEAAEHGAAAQHPADQRECRQDDLWRDRIMP